MRQARRSPIQGLPEVSDRQAEEARGVHAGAVLTHRPPVAVGHHEGQWNVRAAGRLGDTHPIVPIDDKEGTPEVDDGRASILLAEQARDGRCGDPHRVRSDDARDNQHPQVTASVRLDGQACPHVF
jgi:hypothetical protein